MVWYFDLDEFLYSPLDVNLQNILIKYESHTQLFVNWVHFVSHFEKQPSNVVSNFLYRGEYNSKSNGPNGRYNSHKAIVKTNGNIKLGIHAHFYNNNTFGKNASFQEPNTTIDKPLRNTIQRILDNCKNDQGRC